MPRPNHELDAKMWAQGYLNAKKIHEITGLTESTVRRAAERKELKIRRRSDIWVYYSAESLVKLLGPHKGVELALALGVTQTRARELTAGMKAPKKRRVGRPSVVDILLLAPVSRRRREDGRRAHPTDQDPK